MWKRLDNSLRKKLRLKRRQISKIQTEQNRHNKNSDNYEFNHESVPYSQSNWQAKFVSSWNIRDSSDKTLGSKLTDETVIKTIAQAQIFCLQETKKCIKIHGWKCYNLLRENSRWGGICIGVKHQLKHLVTPIKYQCKTKEFSRDI